MSGSTDRLADTTDVNLMIKDLVNARVWHKIYDYGHLTFLMGITMEHMKDVIEILNNDIYWRNIKNIFNFKYFFIGKTIKIIIIYILLFKISSTYIEYN